MATKKPTEPKKKGSWKSDAIRPGSERKPGMRGAAGLISRLTRPALRSRGLANGQILTHWDAIAGSRLAAVTVPERLFKPRNSDDPGGTLRLRVAGAAALELQHVTPLLIERINTYFGYRAVTRLQVVQGPVPKRAEAKRPEFARAEMAKERAALVAQTEDDELKAVLERLGQSIEGRKRRRRRGS